MQFRKKPETFPLLQMLPKNKIVTHRQTPSPSLSINPAPLSPAPPLPMLLSQPMQALLLLLLLYQLLIPSPQA